MRAFWLAAALTVGGAIPAGAEQIGTWTIACENGSNGCIMRFSKRFIDKGPITADLEVQSQSGALVPVIAVRGLTSEMMMAASMAGKAEASVQIPGGIREDLTCNATGVGFICAPTGAAAVKLASALPKARSLVLKAGITISGMSPLPAQEKSLDLAGTADALARLKAAGPVEVARPVETNPGVAALAGLASQSTGGLEAMADKMLKDAGYGGGVDAVRAKLQKYMGR